MQRTRLFTFLSLLAAVCAAGAAAQPNRHGVERRAHAASIAVVVSTRTSVAVQWTALATGSFFVVSRNGRYLGRTWNHHYTLWGLRCGSTYTISVARIDPS